MTQEKHSETENILVRLKRETESSHRATETLTAFHETTFSLPDYLDLLAKFYAFYRTFEPEMEQAIKALEIDFDYRERLKTPGIIVDLQNLGMSREAIAEISGSRDLPPLDSAEKIFGALYVVEGSTLGGQIIARQLKEKFDLDASRGAAFFSGYGSQTGKMWNDFRAKINNFAQTNSNHDEIVWSAIETFKMVGRALARE